MKKMKTRDICLCAMFAALMAVGAFIKIPTPICPITFQSTFALLAGLLLGKKRGALSIAVYVLIGLIGVPVFTGGGGFGYVLNPTFGYLLSFILGAFITGAFVDNLEQPSYLRILLACIVALLVMYAIGMTYLYIIYNYSMGKPIGVGTVLMTNFVTIFPKDVILSFAAAYLAKRLIPVLKKAQ